MVPTITSTKISTETGKNLEGGAEYKTNASDLAIAQAFAEKSFKEFASQSGSGEELKSLVSAKAKIVGGLRYEFIYSTIHCHQATIVLTQSF
jgi:hypothetical protein